MKMYKRENGRKLLTQRPITCFGSQVWKKGVVVLCNFLGFQNLADLLVFPTSPTRPLMETRLILFHFSILWESKNIHARVSRENSRRGNMSNQARVRLKTICGWIWYGYASARGILRNTQEGKALSTESEQQMVTIRVAVRRRIRTTSTFHTLSTAFLCLCCCERTWLQSTSVPCLHGQRHVSVALHGCWGQASGTTPPALPPSQQSAHLLPW